MTAGEIHRSDNLPRVQCTHVGEYMGRCTAWNGHPPDERTGATHWRDESDAERWKTGVWPVKRDTEVVDAERLLALMDEDSRTFLLTALDLRLPDGWSLEIYSTSLLLLRPPGYEAGGGMWAVTVAYGQRRGLWRAPLDAIGGADADTLHRTAQAAVDAVVARYQAHTVGDREAVAA